MNVHPQLVAFAVASLLAVSAWAHPPNPPLNLKLPPGSLPATSATSAMPAPAPASSATITSGVPSLTTASSALARATSAHRPPPGVYYGDTSGAMGNDDTADVPTCDDSTFNDPQVHGDVTTGIFTGNHIGTGTYQGATVNVSKRTGDCEHPGGGFNMSIHVSQSHLNGSHHDGW